MAQDLQDRTSRTDSARYIADLVRRGDRDRYLAALFAPAGARSHLHALAAFAIELAAVARRVSEPIAGEIRLQWWRDALDPVFAGAETGHPVADALGGAVTAGRLPRPALEAMIDAHGARLGDDPMASLEALETHLGATQSALIRLATLILAEGADPGGAEAAGHAGVAVGLARIATDLASPASRALVPRDLLEIHGGSAAPAAPATEAAASPAPAAAVDDLIATARHHLDRARDLAEPLPQRILPAFLPAATVAGDLAGAARTPQARAGDLKRQIAILAAAWRGRI